MAIIGIAVLISVISIILFVSEYGFVKIIEQLVRLSLTILLGYFLYLEVNWVKWLWVVLMYFAGLSSVMAAVWIFGEDMVIQGLWFSVMSLFYIGSSTYLAFFRNRKKGTKKKTIKFQLFWKIFFWFLVITMVPGYVMIISDSIWVVVDFALSIPAFVALYGYAYKKVIFPRALLWKIYVVLLIVWTMVFELLLYPSYKELIAGEIIVSIIISLAAYIGIILYAFNFVKDKK